MNEDFKPSLSIILKEEGGNDDDPRDHGGRTSRGITQREWDVYLKSHNGPSDVWEASNAAVAEIYLNQYWNPYCDDLPSGVDLCFFNASVNSGRQQAVKELQRALGVNADGMLGMETKQAIKDHGDAVALVQAMCDKRRAFYQSLKQFPIYGRGWMGRTDRVEKSAIAMASSIPSPHPKIDTLPAYPDITVSPKADPTQTAQAPVDADTASAGTVAGTVGGAISDQLQQASTAIQPLAEAFTIAKYVCVALTLACAGLAIYAVVKKRHSEAVT